VEPLLQKVMFGHVAFLVQVRNRGPVPLLEDEEVVVFENLVDELVQSSIQASGEVAGRLTVPMASRPISCSLKWSAIKMSCLEAKW